MKQIKVVIIGAGSASFGGGTIADLVASEELKEVELKISLVDIDGKALIRMHRLAQLIKERHKSKATIEATTDRTEALPGADYVIVSVAQKRWQLWEKDFYIPLAFGFRHVFGETAGPGAAFHTLRSLHLMIPMCRDMERICPDALLINFSNPESRVCLAITKLTRVRNVGLCHGPFATLHRISEILKKPPEEIELTVGGINHFHWALQIRDKVTGRDLYSEIGKGIDGFDWGLDTFTPLMYHVFGYFTYPAPSHPGEYVNFAHDIVGPMFMKWGLGQVSRRFGATAAEEVYTKEGKTNQNSYELWSLEHAAKIDRVIEGREPLTPELAETTKELAIPIICDIEFDRNRRELAANVLNSDLAVANLPADAVVEVPISVNNLGIHPVNVGPLPEAIAGICNLQISIQKLLVEAYHQKSKDLLLQALVIDPIVDSVPRAKEMMEVMLRAESEYLPVLE